mmetsp:Transcript_89685/g.134402  ORF Transcript_89685/g.134402 Transcript_89685/m.134402 type:complete len:472 (+) Transcript_89685:134-1549(+)
MKRVTSRQRLVSWDAFDATNDNSSTSEEEYSDYDRPSELMICRKRERSRREKGPTVVPSYQWELPAPSLELDTLAQDVHLHIFSFLDVPEWGTVMSLNKKFRHLLLSSESQLLWLQQCQKHWNLPVMDADSKMVDSLKIPTAAGSYETYQANLRLLFSMTPSDLPSHIDLSLLVNRKLRRTHQHRVEPYTDGKTGESMVRYTGPVGGGDRCIRSDHPLPKPHPRGTTPAWKRAGEKSTLLDLLCRGAAKAVAKYGYAGYRPFVAPFVDRDGSIQVTPRMVAYFEASILEVPDDVDDGDNDQGNPMPPLVSAFRSPRRVECTAVGVATKSFHMHSRMPGWDSHSFGYHGDDGGIYHSSGGMVEQFGPTFGAGDTVGCGIDYVCQGIFYTLNGKFLGYAWKGLDLDLLQNDLYPVVGIDTNAPISVNFGNRPFRYDLKKFNQKHELLIAPCYQHRAGKAVPVPVTAIVPPIPV